MAGNPILPPDQVAQKIAELYESIERRNYWTKRVDELSTELVASGEARLIATELTAIFRQDDNAGENEAQ